MTETIHTVTLAELNVRIRAEFAAGLYLGRRVQYQPTGRQGTLLTDPADWIATGAGSATVAWDEVAQLATWHWRTAWTFEDHPAETTEVNWGTLR